MWYKGSVRALSTERAALSDTGSSSNLRILGLDPGLRLTGYGVIEYHPARPALLDGGVIR